MTLNVLLQGLFQKHSNVGDSVVNRDKNGTLQTV